MKTRVSLLCQTIVLALCERVHLALETMALRRQLAVMARSVRRPQCSPVARCLWVLLSTVWSRWQEALTIVQPDTVRRWRRQGWRHHRRWWRGRKRPGRPAIAAELRALICRMSRENVLWGSPRIHGGLAKLGVRVSRTTIAKYMDRRLGPPSPTWRAFLRHHAGDVVAIGAYAEFARRLHALSAQAIRALRWWLASCPTRALST
jgi:putative transposase